MKETAPYPPFDIPVPPELEGVLMKSPPAWFRDKYIHEEDEIADGFDLAHELANLEGPTIEIGGPTRGGYSVLGNVIGLPHPLLVSNKFLEKPIVYPGELSFMADGRQMPLADESVTVVLTSGVVILPREYEFDTSERGRKVYDAARAEYATYLNDGTPPVLNQRIPIIIEAARVLKRGGLLIATTNSPEDSAVAAMNGFEPMQKHTSTLTIPETDTTHTSITSVFRKRPV